jgi:hypothetical protein
MQKKIANIFKDDAVIGLPMFFSFMASFFHVTCKRNISDLGEYLATILAESVFLTMLAYLIIAVACYIYFFLTRRSQTMKRKESKLQIERDARQAIAVLIGMLVFVVLTIVWCATISPAIDKYKNAHAPRYQPDSLFVSAHRKGVAQFVRLVNPNGWTATYVKFPCHKDENCIVTTNVEFNSECNLPRGTYLRMISDLGDTAILQVDDDVKIGCQKGALIEMNYVELEKLIKMGKPPITRKQLTEEKRKLVQQVWDDYKEDH